MLRRFLARYYYKFKYVFVQSTRYSRQNLSRHEIPREIFEKLLKYQISFTVFQRKTSFSMRTDRRTERNNKSASRFWQFCARPKKRKQRRQHCCVFTPFTTFWFYCLYIFLITNSHDLHWRRKKKVPYLRFRQYVLRPEFFLLGITLRYDHLHESDGWSLTSPRSEVLNMSCQDYLWK